MNVNVNFGMDARTRLSTGIKKLASAVTSTLGPNGRNVIIEQESGNPISTKDGVTVAKSINFKEKVENIGVQLLKQAAIKTAEQAGDGTTTSTLIASALYETGLINQDDHLQRNVVEVKRGIDQAVKDVVTSLREMSIEITDDSQLKNVATISANNDPEVGELVATAMDKVGTDGVITVEESRTGETYLEAVEGMQFERGFKSPYFVTDNSTMTAVLNNPLILITDKRITSAKDLLPIMEACSAQNKALLIIADDIDGEALSLLVVNKARGILSSVAVKAPEFGDRKKAVLEDIATLTGGTVISQEKGMRLDKIDPSFLGKARKVTVGRDTTTIIDGKGSGENIQQRIEEVKELIGNTQSPYEVEQLQDRLGRIVGGVAVLHVGGLTEVEMKERKDRVEDALHATRAALEEGILPGGGIALFRVGSKLTSEYTEKITDESDRSFGYYAVLTAIQKPFEKILINAGYDYMQIEIIRNALLNDHTDQNVGFNIQTEEYVNMIEKGIIDPTKVTRMALENGASVAGTMLITECVVSLDPEDLTKTNNPNLGEF